MYVCTINNFMSLFEIIDIVKNVTLNNILLEETKQAILEIQQYFTNVSNSKKDIFFYMHKGYLHICFSMETVVINEMQREQNILLSKCKILSTKDEDINDCILNEVVSLCDDLEKFYDKYIQIADDYQQIRNCLLEEINIDMNNIEIIQNQRFM